MVTFHLCQMTRQVRFLLPPPIIVLFAVFCLTLSAAAVDEDLDHYAAAPDTLAVSLASADSLAKAVVNGSDTLFGVGFRLLNGKVIKVGQYDMTGRADGVQELATELYDLALGIDAVAADSSSWLEQIYDQLYTTSRSGDVVTKMSIAELTSQLLAPTSGGYNALVNGGVWRQSGRYISDVLADISSSLYYQGFANNFLDYGGLPATGVLGTGGVTGMGFLGLAHLLFRSDGQPVHGLDYNGDDKEGARGSWSIADILGNGFSGLARLIGGPYNEGESRHGVWTWVDPTDPTNTREYEPDNLFELFWELGWLQNSLAKLEFVYASQDDIDFKTDELPNMDAVKDEFFGDASNAVTPSGIKDLSSAVSDLKSAFTPSVSIFDFFSTIGDGGNYIFFSQETANNLNPIVNPSAAAIDEEDIDPFEGYVLGDDGLYYPDNSLFDVASYLEGLS